MFRRPPRSTRTDTSFPTRRSSDLTGSRAEPGAAELGAVELGAVELGAMKSSSSKTGGGRHHDPGATLAVCGEFFTVPRSEEHTSELQSLMRISYAVFCLKHKKKQTNIQEPTTHSQNTKTTR